MASMHHIHAHYIVTCPASEAAKQARDLMIEQTVEVPESLVADKPDIMREVVAELDIDPFDESGERHRVVVHYNTVLACGQLPQLLNLLYGNISIKNNIRLVNVELPASFVERFAGPRYGLEGLREILGVYDRPLLATAVKPRGSSVETFAEICRQFALGGGDVIKDDHNLVDADFDSFRRRVDACHIAVEQANLKTGRNCLYFPSVTGRFDQLEPQIEHIARMGMRGVLIAPMLTGLDAVRHLSGKHDVMFMAHPTFTGTCFHDRTHGLTPAVLLGQLFRLASCDISVFPNFGGRFGFTRQECIDLSDAMLKPFEQLKPGVGAPAGGMQLHNLPDMIDTYGNDIMLLIGGGLLSLKPTVEEGTRVFHDAIVERTGQRLTKPLRPSVSACEAGGSGVVLSSCDLPQHADVDAVVLEHLPFDHFHWAGRKPSSYKATELQGDLPFREVVRHELLGRFGEPMAFHLRYFEIGPGGHSSREKHQHIHAIIGVRGEGALELEDRTVTIKPMDIAYVPPMRVHRLSHVASSCEPFGFFCIVDAQRDRPIKP